MKSKIHSNDNPNMHSPEDSDLEKQIRRRAHEIWLASGCCHGDDVRHWLDAERQVLAEIQRQTRKRS